MSELHQPDAAEQGGEPRVPADPPWGVAAGLAVVVAYLLVQQLLGALTPDRRDPASVMAVLTVGGLLFLLLVRVLLRTCGGAGSSPHRLIGLVPPGRAGLRRAVAPILLGALAYAGVAIGWGLVLQRLHNGPIPEQPVIGSIRGARSAPAIVLALIGGALVAPTVEEVLLRGMLYLPLRRALGVGWAAVLVSLVFALVHFYGWGLPQFFVLSLIFVALFERTGTLLAPIAAHAAFNAVQIIMVLKGWM